MSEIDYDSESVDTNNFDEQQNNFMDSEQDSRFSTESAPTGAKK